MKHPACSFLAKANFTIHGKLATSSRLLFKVTHRLIAAPPAALRTDVNLDFVSACKTVNHLFHKSPCFATKSEKNRKQAPLDANGDAAG